MDIFCNSMRQRKLQAASIDTTGRKEMQPSPYLHFTQTQVNMRRKVEVLKYISSAAVSVAVSKNMLWSQMAQGTSSSASSRCATSVDSMDPGNITYTSACNVPGPIVPIYYDPAVPLYNISSSTSTSI